MYLNSACYCQQEPIPVRNGQGAWGAVGAAAGVVLGGGDARASSERLRLGRRLMAACPSRIVPFGDGLLEVITKSPASSLR